MSAESYQKSTEHLTANAAKMTRAQALQAVRAPATGLLAVSGLALAIAGFTMFGTVGYYGMKLMSANEDETMAYVAPNPDETKEEREARKKIEDKRAAENNFVMLSSVFLTAMSLVFVNSIVLAGAWKMRNLQRHKSAVAGAAVAIIPILSPLVIVGIPFGIWAMIKLNNPEIKRYFTN